jgi:hypothetical protein
VAALVGVAAPVLQVEVGALLAVLEH